MKKAYIESTRRGVFGTTSARINAMVKKDDYQLPGPAHYSVKETSKVHEPKHKQPMGVFSSLSNRVHEDIEAKVRAHSCLYWNLELPSRSPCGNQYLRVDGDLVYHFFGWDTQQRVKNLHGTAASELAEVSANFITLLLVYHRASLHRHARIPQL